MENGNENCSGEASLMEVTAATDFGVSFFFTALTNIAGRLLISDQLADKVLNVFKMLPAGGLHIQALKFAQQFSDVIPNLSSKLLNMSEHLLITPTSVLLLEGSAYIAISGLSSSLLLFLCSQLVSRSKHS